MMGQLIAHHDLDSPRFDRLGTPDAEAVGAALGYLQKLSDVADAQIGD